MYSFLIAISCGSLGFMTGAALASLGAQNREKKNNG